jgi:hypothetical protein
MEVVSDKEPIGWVIDNSAHDSFAFVVIEGKQVEFGNYYIVKHPTRGVDVLTRAVAINYKNPEMDLTRYGPRYAKKGLKLPSSDQEILVTVAEPLGYFDGNKFRPLEVPPSTWTPVYEAKEEDLKKFIEPSEAGYYLKIGNLRNLQISISLDVNGLVKGHCFVCGMTRSGKSTFLLSLAALGKKELDPPMHMIIFDRRGEYIPLVEKAGGKWFSYTEFTKPFKEMDPADVASMLKVERTLLRLTTSAIERMQSDGISKPTVDNLRDYILKEIDTKATPQHKQRYKSIIEDNLKKYGPEIEKLPTESKDPVEIVRKNELSLIDFSVDTDISRQQLVVRDFVRALLKEAMTNDNFGAIIAIEEVQYFAPEVQMVKYGENWKDSSDAIVEAVSQGGGYNLGFIIMTQRPAYVSKSVISQCNSVVSFRLMSGNDQEAIINYTEYGSRALRQYLAGLADHEAFICGIAVPCRFPVIVETRVEDYPRKSTKNAKQTFESMK